jgi:hypothetical protein
MRCQQLVSLGLVSLIANPHAAAAQHVASRDSGEAPPRLRLGALSRGTDAACTMVGLRVTTRDSVLPEPPAEHCPSGRLVVVGLPREVPAPEGVLSRTHRFEIPIALENTGATIITLPLGVRRDSVTAVQHGRQLPASLSRPYHEMVFVSSYDGQWEWSLGAGGGQALRPGERSPALTFVASVQPLAQGLRFWFGVERLHERRPSEQAVPPRRAANTSPLSPLVQRFLLAAGLGQIRRSHAVFRLSDPDLTMFSVTFGKPNDCPSGCFYSSALGLQYKGSIGWLSMNNYDDQTLTTPQAFRRDSFPASAADAFLMSHALLDTMARALGSATAPGVTELRDFVARHPAVPRSTLVGHVESLYAVPDERFGRLLATAPRVRDDSELLTLLAYLPYEGGKTEARNRLIELAPTLIHDPTTSERTLFLLAQWAGRYVNTPLHRELRDHPNARTSIPVLTIIAFSDREARQRAVAAVRASQRVRDMLTFYLERGNAPGVDVGMQLLRDPEAGTNVDVLLVLANAGIDYEVLHAASRRLPETALRSLDFTYHPIR